MCLGELLLADSDRDSSIITQCYENNEYGMKYRIHDTNDNTIAWGNDKGWVSFMLSYKTVENIIYLIRRYRILDFTYIIDVIGICSYDVSMLRPFIIRNASNFRTQLKCCIPRHISISRQELLLVPEIYQSLSCTELSPNVKILDLLSLPMPEPGIVKFIRVDASRYYIDDVEVNQSTFNKQLVQFYTDNYSENILLRNSTKSSRNSQLFDSFN